MSRSFGARPWARARTLHVCALAAVIYVAGCSEDEAGGAGKPAAHFQRASQAVAENGGTIQIGIELDRPPSRDISVPFSLSGDASSADFTLAASAFRVSAGQRTGSVALAVLDDQSAEPDKTLLITLGQTNEVSLATPAAYTLTIADDDGDGGDDKPANDPEPTLSVAGVSALESAGEVALSITLSNPAAQPITADFGTRDGSALAGSDYLAAEGTVLFFPGETTKEVTVFLLDDALNEADESFSLEITRAEGATIGAAGTALIADDDPEPTVAWGVSEASAAESAGSLRFQVALSAPSGRDVLVPFAADAASSAQGGSDYLLDPTPLFIPAGAGGAEIAVTIADDLILEPTERLVLALGTPEGATLAAASALTLTITDDDRALELRAAETLDVDLDGHLDHYKLTFAEPVRDSSFPGYRADDAGAPQSDWLAAGYGEVALANGAAAPEPDVANDEVLYLRFTESHAPDTGLTPDITTTATPGLVAASGYWMLPLGSGDLAESDGAAPVLVRATTETGTTSLFVFFSEPVAASGACPGGSAGAAALAYDDVSGDGVTGVGDGYDLDGCDGRIVLAASAGTFASTDIYTDRLAPLADSVFDAVGNAAPPLWRTIGATFHPYVLGAASVDGVTARLEYSEAVDDAALDLASYTYNGGDCDPSATLAAVTLEESGSYLLTTSSQVSGCIYTITVVGDVRDVDEDALLIEPRSASFEGNAALRVMWARARSLRSFIVAFSKPVDPVGAADVRHYTISGALGAVTSAARLDTMTGRAVDTNKVFVTHSRNQGGAFYSVIVSTELTTPTGEPLAPNPFDRATFQGLAGSVRSIDEGPLFDDPFGDGTLFAFVYGYAGKIYAGPNDNNTAVFRFDPDGRNPLTVTFETKSASPASPYESFGANLARPALAVEAAGGTVARYWLTPGTDLSVFAPGALAVVTGCTSAANNRRGPALVIDDAAESVEVDGLTAPVTALDETCLVTLANGAGPGAFDGVDAFAATSVGGQSYLVFGAHNVGGGGFPEIYFTQDVDNVLDNDYCTISPVTLGNTESLQTIYGYGDKLYIGFNSDVATKPVLAYLDLSATGATCYGLNDQVINVSTKKAREIDYLGANGLHPNTAMHAGIDRILVYDDGLPALYIANNGGLARTSTIPPTAASTWSVVRHDGDGFWSGTTQAAPRLGRMRPGERGVPVMLEWGGLLVGRNRSDNGAAELWKYLPGGGWTKIVDTADATGGMNRNNSDLSLVTVVGGRLYLGFDNDADGAELWRTKAGVAAGDFWSQAQLERVGVSGFGPVGAPDLAKNKHILSDAAVTFDGHDYLYMSVGCEEELYDDGPCDRDPTPGATDFAVRIYRQVD